MGERIKGINEVKGKNISDLEALLVVMYKAIDDKVQDKPGAGITLAKGQKNERKVKYKDAKTDLQKLVDYFAQKGCFSFGVCETCTSFDTRGHENKCFGTCALNGKTCHIWNTCQQHSKKGGGYGL